MCKMRFIVAYILAEGNTNVVFPSVNKVMEVYPDTLKENILPIAVAVKENETFEDIDEVYRYILGYGEDVRGLYDSVSPYFSSSLESMFRQFFIDNIVDLDRFDTDIWTAYWEGMRL